MVCESKFIEGTLISLPLAAGHFKLCLLNFSSTIVRMKNFLEDMLIFYKIALSISSAVSRFRISKIVGLSAHVLIDRGRWRLIEKRFLCTVNATTSFYSFFHFPFLRDSFHALIKYIFRFAVNRLCCFIFCSNQGGLNGKSNAVVELLAL